MTEQRKVPKGCKLVDGKTWVLILNNYNGSVQTEVWWLKSRRVQGDKTFQIAAEIVRSRC
jgi:hypothetical protein